MPGEAWYNGAHSLSFSDGTRETSGPRTGYLKVLYNTWETWHLIPAKKPIVASPQVSTSYIEVPGRYGAIDMSTYLTGTISYGQRSGSWEFILDNGWEDWETVRSKMFNTLHGNQFHLVLEDVPLRYWLGRFSINDFRSDPTNNIITINYILEPFSYPVLELMDDWLWDPFNFETDYTNGMERSRML